MSCAKCGGLTAYLECYDGQEQHEVERCLICSWQRWVNPVPFAPPDQPEHLCDTAR